MSGNSIHKNHRKRMREDFRKTGFKPWQPHIVLEFLLYYAIPRRNTNDIAHELINKCGGFMNVFSASREQLMSVDHVGEAAADYIMMLGEFMEYCNEMRIKNKEFVLDSRTCEEYFINLFDGKKQEYFYMICLDAKNRIIHQDMLFEGSIESTEIDAGKIVRIAVNSKAACVVFAHNHPSGVAKPSYADVEATQIIEKKLRVVDIGLLDHIIVADKKCVSMRSMNCLTTPMDKLRRKLKG